MEGSPREMRGTQAAPVPPKLRRRPSMVAGSVAALTVGALVGGWAFVSLSESQSVVAVRSTVHRGQVIAREDLITVQIGVDPALKPVPAAGLDDLVGKRAALDLAAGGLLTAGEVTVVTIPAPGQTVVGINLPAGQMPAMDLQPGDRVRIVSTPGSGGEAPATGSVPAEVTATVVSVQQRSDTTAASVVNVSVLSQAAASLAAQAATGKVALVLDSPAG